MHGTKMRQVLYNGIQQIGKNCGGGVGGVLNQDLQPFLQTRQALLKILDDLTEDDYFGLILFSSRVSPWKRELLQATQTNVKMAKQFVREIEDGGGKTGLIRKRHFIVISELGQCYLTFALACKYNYSYYYNIA